MARLERDDEPTRRQIEAKFDRLFERGPGWIEPALAQPGAGSDDHVADPRPATGIEGDPAMERIGVAFAGGGMTPPEIVECVQLAEELGYESAWVAEGHGGDQFSILTACALATSRIRLGTSISSVFVRSAPTIAMAAACVDHFSNGRFILGLGSSHKVQVEPEHGLEFSGAIPRVRDTVDIVRRLLRDGAVTDYHGEAISIATFDLHFPTFRPENAHLSGGGFPQDAGDCRRDQPGRSAHLVHAGTRTDRQPAHRRRRIPSRGLRWNPSRSRRWFRCLRRAPTMAACAGWPQPTPDDFPGIAD